MMNKLTKVSVCLTICCSTIAAVAAQEVHVGELRLSSSSSISKLVKLEATSNDSSQSDALVIDSKGSALVFNKASSNLIKALNDTPGDLKLNKDQTLKVSELAPHNLLLIDNTDNKNQVTTIDNDVDSKIQQFERSNWYLYVKNDEDASQLTGFNAKTQQVIEITKMPIGYKMFSVTNTGHMLTTDGEAIYHVQLILRGDHVQVNENWQPVKMTTKPCIQGISSLSISHFGNKIAIQCA